MDQHFRIGMGCELMAPGFQFGAQLPVIINFPVKGEHQVFILVINGLVALLQIDDTQPAESHRDRFIHIKPTAVRAPVGDPIRHPLHNSCRTADGSSITPAKPQIPHIL